MFSHGWLQISGEDFDMRITAVAAIVMVTVLVTAARNSVAGELDDLLLDREPPRMTLSMQYSPVPPDECMSCPTDRSICKQIICAGGPGGDAACSMLGCSSCVYDVSTMYGKCSGGSNYGGGLGYLGYPGYGGDPAYGGGDS